MMRKLKHVGEVKKKYAVRDNSTGAVLFSSFNKKLVYKYISRARFHGQELFVYDKNVLVRG